MNPLTQVRNQRLMTEKELQLGTANTQSSWHSMFKDSAWIYIGGLDYELTEGDVICVFSQYGEVVNVNLVRDQSTGKSKGFAFLCYEDQRSTVLACDNLNGARVVGRTLRVNHVESYKVKELIKPDDDPVKQRLKERGCAPEVGHDGDLSPPRRRRSPPAAPGGSAAPVRVKREKIDPNYPDYQPSDRSRSRNGHPGSRDGHSGSRDGHPGSRDGHPGSRDGHPGSRDGHPGSRDGHPGSKDRQVASTNRRKNYSHSRSRSRDGHPGSKDRQVASTNRRKNYSHSRSRSRSRSRDGHPGSKDRQVPNPNRRRNRSRSRSPPSRSDAARYRRSTTSSRK